MESVKQDLPKRIFDIVLGSILLVIFIPFFSVVATLIKITSSGPVFFLQKRCGKNGREFKMYKFRTMIKDAESLKIKLKSDVDGPMFKMKNDPRITSIGRFLRRWSLDELPQLFNVLKGEMSLVGPRPLSNDEMTRNNEWKEIRLSVKPGATGLWQITGKSSGKFSDWIKYDTEYVKKRSLFFDFKILSLTITAVLKNKEYF
ncbi:MAG TPA: sugar transferase [Candidatus Wujingus californicus]|uniref:sugar transferase n=1 Tax=Candidatus Wujingus californicus TaxID=3367618 RepID=UPI001DC9C88A|nr:sugar transferase [Planctomycetota bacterium]MDO8130472.1 sugar transferase [Candidatus Brocadiales bacterium]